MDDYVSRDPRLIEISCFYVCISFKFILCANIEVVYKEVKLRMTLPRDVGPASPTAPTVELSIVQLDPHYSLSLLLHIFLYNRKYGQIQQTLRHRGWRIASPAYRLSPREQDRSHLANRRIRHGSPFWCHGDILEIRQRSGTIVRERKGSSGWFQAYPWWNSSCVPCMFTCPIPCCYRSTPWIHLS